MEDKAEASLTEVRKGEAEAQVNGAFPRPGLEHEVQHMKKEKGESTSRSASIGDALMVYQRKVYGKFGERARRGKRSAP